MQHLLTWQHGPGTDADMDTCCYAIIIVGRGRGGLEAVDYPTPLPACCWIVHWPRVRCDNCPPSILSFEHSSEGANRHSCWLLIPLSSWLDLGTWICPASG